MRRLLFSLMLLYTSSVAFAQADDAVDEIVVWGDLFARWDNTRWLVTTEIGLPYALTFMKDENLQFRSASFQIRTILSCSKQWKRGRRRYEVDCEIEDFGFQAAPIQNERREKQLANAQLVIDEIDAKLTGAKLQLTVADDGRVLGLDLEGVPNNGGRQSNAHETLRQIMSRVSVGFDLKLRKYNQLHEGKWVEYNTALMTMPTPPELSGISGSSMLVHYLNKYRGHVLVQSVGKGVVSAPDPKAKDGRTEYITDLTGVSIFDAEEGYMTERVWALNGRSTASSFFATGNYWHAGKITLLGEADRPSVGPTRMVAPPKTAIVGLEKWEPIER